MCQTNLFGGAVDDVSEERGRLSPERVVALMKFENKLARNNHKTCNMLFPEEKWTHRRCIFL
jgi:hypothetical protein